MLYRLPLLLFLAFSILGFRISAQNLNSYGQDSLLFFQLHEQYKKTIFSDVDSALIILNDQRNIVDRWENNPQNYLALAVLCFNNYGIYYKSKSQFDSAISYYHKSLELNKKLDAPDNLATGYNNIANIHYMKGEYSISLQMHLEALNLRLEIADTAGIAMSNANIGLIHDSLKEFEQAIAYYEKATKIFLALDNKRGIAYTYSSMGLTHHNLQNYDMADSLLRLSMSIRLETNDLRGVEYCLLNLGTLNLDKFEMTQDVQYLHLADDQLTQVDNMAKSSGDKWGNIAALNGLAKSALFQKSNDLSLIYLNKALQFTDEIDSEKQLSLTYLLLSQVHEQNKNYAKSLDFYKLHKSVNDTLFNIEKDKEIGRKQAWFEYNQALREREIATENQVRLNEIEQARQKLIIVIIGLSLVLLVITTIYIYNQWKKTKSEKEVVEDFNKTLQRQIEQIQRKLENKKEELPPHMSKLSKRELEVLLLVGKGLSDQEIADNLFVSITTVRTHNRRIFNKLLINNRAEALSILDQFKLI